VSWRLREYACRDCGRVVRRRWRADRAPVCWDCGIQRSVETVARQVTVAQARRIVRARQGADIGGS